MTPDVLMGKLLTYLNPTYGIASDAPDAGAVPEEPKGTAGTTDGASGAGGTA